MFSMRASVVRTGERAFTILELLVSAVIFVIMLALLGSVIMHFNTAWRQGDAQKERRQNARVIFDTISRDLQGAVPALPGTGTNRVPFQVQQTNNSDALLWGTSLPANRTRGDFATVGYFVDSQNRLYRCQTNAAESDLDTLTASAGGSNFTGLLAENVVSLTATAVARDGSTNTIFTTNLPVAVDLTLLLADWRTLKQNPNLTVPDPSNPPADVQVFRTRVELPAAP